MKQRFTLSDVVAMAWEVRERCVDARVANVYDVDARTLMLKLSRDGSNRQLLVESGVRFLVTKYDARGAKTDEKHEMPSGFCAKLRSLLKGKRVSDVRVLGFDRVLCVRFGAGANAAHFILEMYAQGNVVVADADFTVTAALRTGPTAALDVGDTYERGDHKLRPQEEDDDDSVLSVPHLRALAAVLAAERADRAAQKAAELKRKEEADRAAQMLRESGRAQAPTGKRHKKAPKHQQTRSLSLRQVLVDARSGLGRYGQDVVDHCAAVAGVDASAAVEAVSDEDLERLCRAGRDDAPKLLKERLLSDTHDDAVLFLADDGGQTYAGFAPVRFAQHGAKKCAAFPSFCEAVDEYFRSFADAKLASANDSEKRAIASRVDKIRDDQQRRVDELQRDREARSQRAATLEARADDVDKVLAVLRAALDAGLKWDEVEAYVREEKDRGSALAGLVESIDFPNRRVTLTLDSLEFFQDDDDDDDDDDSESEKQRTQKVTVSLDASAMASAREQWATAKKARDKAAKTESAAAAVVAAAERQTKAQLAKREATAKAQLARVDRASAGLWFLKYSWFLSSEGYLCVCPRDKGQAEAVLFQLFRRGKDALVCVDGARDFPPCVVRGKKDPQGWRVSPLALAEAGSFVACRSSAWARRDRCAAFWVDDVRREPPHSQSWDLVFGSMIDGNFAVPAARKHYLPASTLELQLAVVFLATRECGYFGEDRVDDLVRLREPVAEERVAEDDAPDKAAEEEKKVSFFQEEDDTDDTYRSLGGTVDGVSEGKAEPPEEKEEVEDEAQETEPRQQEQALPQPAPKKNGSKKASSTPPPPASLSSGAKKRGGKKKKGAQRRRDDSSSDDERATVDPALEIVSKRDRRKGVTPQQQQTKKASPNLTTTTTTTSEAPPDSAPRLEAARKAACDAIERMSAAKRSAWDRAAAMVAPDVLPAMAFELGFVADDMSDADAVEALGLFYDAERTALTREAARREEEQALARRRGGPVASSSSSSDKPRNVPALLSGICRRVANKRNKPRTPKTDGDDEAPEEDDEDDAATIAALTGRPREEDELLDAVVVCAPSLAARHFKLALKLTPGPAKKGKAAKDALEILGASPEATDAEKELLKRVALNDVIAALVGGVKIATAKLNELKQKRKVVEKQLKKKNFVSSGKSGDDE